MGARPAIDVTIITTTITAHATKIPANLFLFILPLSCNEDPQLGLLGLHRYLSVAQFVMPGTKAATRKKMPIWSSDGLPEN